MGGSEVLRMVEGDVIMYRIAGLQLLELSDWECQLFGMGPTGITFRPAKGNEPNWFWRWMQFIILGNHWVKVSTKKA